MSSKNTNQSQNNSNDSNNEVNSPNDNTNTQIELPPEGLTAANAEKNNETNKDDENKLSYISIGFYDVKIEGINKEIK